MKELTLEDLKAKREELQGTLRANTDKYVKTYQSDLTTEIDEITKKIVELIK